MADPPANEGALHTRDFFRVVSAFAERRTAQLPTGLPSLVMRVWPSGFTLGRLVRGLS